MTLDELFEILDCYVEENLSILNPSPILTQPWTGNSNDSVPTRNHVNKSTTVRISNASN